MPAAESDARDGDWFRPSIGDAVAGCCAAAWRRDTANRFPLGAVVFLLATLAIAAVMPVLEYMNCVLINYPAEEERQWDAVVTRISLSLGR